MLAAATLSGAAALAAEVLWTRALTLLFGAGMLAAVVVVAAFMAGLGAGAWLGARMRAPWARAALVRVACLEGGMALAIATTPFWMAAIDALPLPLASVAAAAAMGVAACAMGAAFAYALAGARAIGVSLGMFYGINTLGGAIGALLPLALLPTLGWTHALWWIALGDAAAAACYALLAWRMQQGVAAFEEAGNAPRIGLRMAAYALVGAAALMLEIGWVRLYGAAWLRTEYVLAVLLCAYLAGIGLGGALGARLSSRWLPAGALLAAAAGLASVLAWPPLARWAQQAVFPSFAAGVAIEALASFALIAPTTLALGAWLPWAAGCSDGARWYAANAFGGALGAALGGAWLLPWLGGQRLVVVACLLLLLAAAAWTPRRRWAWVLACVPLAVWVWPLVPPAKLVPSLADTRERFRFEDAIAWTEVVEHPNGERVLLSDLLRMDAATDPTSVVVQRHQAWLAALAHGKPRSALLLGLGSGITASALADVPTLRRIVAVEIAAGAIEAARRSYFRPLQRGVLQRLEIVHADVRRWLKQTDQRFDLIIGDLFHPDLAGRGALISLEQFQQAKRALAENGVFVQWIALNQFDVAGLKLVLRTFAAVFPDADVFVDGYRLALVGQKGDQALAPRMLAASWAQQPTALGEEKPLIWLGRWWGKAKAVAGEGALQRQWHPVLEYRLPRLRVHGVDLAQNLRWLFSWRTPAEQAARVLGVPEDAKAAFLRAWGAATLTARAWFASLEGKQALADRMLALAARTNPEDIWARWGWADRLLAQQGEQALGRILSLAPDHPDALLLRWQQAVRIGAPDEDAWRRRFCAIDPLARGVCIH